MPATEAETKVVREVVVDASPETIFPFLVEPEKLKRWKGIEARLDPRPGGEYYVNVTGRDIARGEYVEVVPNRKVIFTWGWESPDSPVQPGTSTVEISLHPEGGKTRIRLEHRDLPSPEAAQAHVEGWEHYLERLAIVVDGGDPGVDPWTERPAE